MSNIVLWDDTNIVLDVKYGIIVKLYICRSYHSYV